MIPALRRRRKAASSLFRYPNGRGSIAREGSQGTLAIILISILRSGWRESNPLPLAPQASILPMNYSLSLVISRLASHHQPCAGSRLDIKLYRNLKLYCLPLQGSQTAWTQGFIFYVRILIARLCLDNRKFLPSRQDLSTEGAVQVYWSRRFSDS